MSFTCNQPIELAAWNTEKNLFKWPQNLPIILHLALLLLPTNIVPKTISRRQKNAPSLLPFSSFWSATSSEVYSLMYCSFDGWNDVSPLTSLYLSLRLTSSLSWMVSLTKSDLIFKTFHPLKTYKKSFLHNDKDSLGGWRNPFLLSECSIMSKCQVIKSLHGLTTAILGVKYTAWVLLPTKSMCVQILHNIVP